MADENSANGDPQRPIPTRPVIAPPEPPSATLSVGAGSTKVVACKLPMGLRIMMREWQQVWEPTQTGGRQVQQHLPVMDPNDPDRPLVYEIRGNAAIQEQQLQGIVRDTGGYALTYGFPAEAWENWYEYNKNGPFIRNRMVMAFDTEIEAIAWCLTAENRDARSGLERLDPARPELHTGRIRMRNDVGGVSEPQQGSRG